MPTCATCFETVLAACPPTIRVKAGLTPNTEFFWLLTAPTGILYQRTATSDSLGDLLIDTSKLPQGLLTPGAGFFKLELRKGDNYLDEVPMMLQGAGYECAYLGFQDRYGTSNQQNQVG